MSTPKTSLAVIAGLSLVGALAGCSDPSASGTGSGATEDYADGTYTEAGTYASPSGIESVEVTITLADNVITDIDVVGDATDPQARLHQTQFTSGIAAVVVGKNINEIQVHKVGGSSLTSGGFNKALDAIKADAVA